MRIKCMTGIFSIAVVMMLSGCGAGNSPEPEPSVAVKRTYEKVDPSPAVVADSYDLRLKLDTENDRLTEKVSMDIQNNTDSPVDTVYLRYNPMGYFDYLCEARPDAADANKGKKAEITSIKFAGVEKELTAEYLLDDTSVKISLAGDAMEPGEKRTLIVDAWTDIPDVEDRFGMLRRDEGKLYALALCFPYVDCSSNGMWQIDPPLYLGGGGENRNPDFRNYHVEIDVPEEFEVACAGVPVKKDGIVSVDLENIRDFAVVVSDFMDVDTFETRGVTIRNYYLSIGDTDAYREISKQTIIDSFAFYTDLLGDYQRKEYSMAQYIDGMEYSGFAVVDGRTLMDGGPDDGNKLMRNTAHEVGHSWFYDAVGNNEYNEGWIDEGIISYLAAKELVLKDIEAYKTEKEHGSDWTSKDQANAVKESDGLIEENQLKALDHCYLNASWYEYPENSDPGDKEYIYAPVFLAHAKEIMGEEAFNSFLREVYQTYAMKIVHSEEILKILRKYDNSSKMNDLIAFYFDGR